MRCPKCKSASEVMFTRHFRARNATKRMRRCKTCGKRFRTEEMIVLERNTKC